MWVISYFSKLKIQVWIKILILTTLKHGGALSVSGGLTPCLHGESVPQTLLSLIENHSCDSFLFVLQPLNYKSIHLICKKSRNCCILQWRNEDCTRKRRKNRKLIKLLNFFTYLFLFILFFKLFPHTGETHSKVCHKLSLSVMYFANIVVACVPLCCCFLLCSNSHLCSSCLWFLSTLVPSCAKWKLLCIV